MKHSQSRAVSKTTEPGCVLIGVRLRQLIHASSTIDDERWESKLNFAPELQRIVRPNRTDCYTVNPVDGHSIGKGDKPEVTRWRSQVEPFIPNLSPADFVVAAGSKLRSGEPVSVPLSRYDRGGGGS